MASPKHAGRLIGALLFVQLSGLIVPFVVLNPAITPTFLQDAASHGPAVRTAVLLLLANAALSMVIAVIMFSVLWGRHNTAALLLLAVSVIWIVLQATDNTFLLSMLSLSERYYSGKAGELSYLGTIGEVVRGMRRSAHYATLLAVEGWFLAFYAALSQSRLAPRPLAILGLAMVVLHAVGVTAPMFLNFEALPVLAPYLAVSHIVLSVWLVAKGFHLNGSING